jgi:hypothetical protein
MTFLRWWRRYESFSATLPLLSLAYLPSFILLLGVAQEVYRNLSAQGWLFWLSLFPMFSYSLPGWCLVTWIARIALPGRLPHWALRGVTLTATVLLLPHYAGCILFQLLNGISTEGLVP